ncbi:MAG: DUF4328 domain-containing protein [Janthinobacterium lividum]
MRDQWSTGSQGNDDVPFFAPTRGEFSGHAAGFGTATVGGGSHFGGQSVGGQEFIDSPSGGFGAPVSTWGARAGAPDVVTGLRPVHGLATATLALSGVWVGLALLSAVTLTLSQTSVVAPGAAIFALGAVKFAAWIVTSIWLWRARHNARRINPAQPPRGSAVWVWLGWFFPVACLFMPFLLITDIFAASRHTARQSLRSPAFGAWWSLWLLGAFTSNVSASDGLHLSHTGMTVLAWFSAVAIAAALPLWMGVVRAVTAAQSR